MQDEEQKRQKQKIHQKSLEKIKKEIAIEDIEGKMISYSFLDKQNNSGISTNLRLFFLYQKQCIGYINQLPKGTQLPFKSKEFLPKLKNSISLQEIEKVTDEKELLKINFKSKEKKGEWIFKCQPVIFAKAWAKMINNSIQQMKDDKLNLPGDIVVQPPEQLIQQIENQNEKKFGDRPQSHKKEGGNQAPMRPFSNKRTQSNNQGNSNEVNSEAPVFGQGIVEQNNILKPKSSLFVGGMSVQSQKDQIELKNRMQSIQNVTSKMKQQYERKKQQQKNLEEQIINPMSIAQNILSFSTNVKYQIEKMQREWGYQFAKSQNEYEIVQKFKFYVEAVSGKIIDELGLEEKKRYYQPQEVSNYWLRYEISGVLFQVYLTQLRQINSHIYSFIQKGTVISNEQAKHSSHQFKNYDYFLRLTANKGRVRVPLSMMTQHKGMTVYAKVLIPTAQTFDNMEVLEKQLQIIETESRINNSVFQDPEPETGKILALQAKVYQKLARAENSNKRFNICIIEGLKYYLPHDFNNFSKEKPNQRLRWQLIQDDECQQRVLFGEDMCAVSARLKMAQNLRDGINQLTQVSKFIIERVTILVQELESVDQSFTNSEELSEIMHKLGINMRYLGMILEKSKENWLKQIIMSEICARCAKKFLNFDLQDCLLNINQANIGNVHKFQVTQVIKFLNKMMGNGQQTDTFWKQLNRQSQSQYRVSVNRQQINQAYLLQAIQHNCCIRLKNVRGGSSSEIDGKSGLLSGLIDKNSIQFFSTISPFSVHNFASFQHKSKVYNLQFNELYSTVKSILSSPTLESFEQLQLLLNLKKTQNVASHYRMSNMYANIVKYLINWLSPQQAYNIYNPQEIQLGEILPSKLLYSIKLAEIRWGLKNGKIDEAEKTKEWVIEHVNKWIGDCHPILTELYEIYANYFMMFKDQQKKAINYCKSAIKNQEKLIGPNHHKMADSYYLIGSVYLNYGKKSESINSMKKAKQIILKSSNEQSEAYGEVCLKMGQLLLSLNLLKQALESGGEAMAVLEKYQNQQAYIQSIELTCRCFEVLQDWESYLTLIESSLVHKVIVFIDEIEQTERIIKLCILPNFKLIAQTNTNISQRILKIISELPETARAPNMAYNFLRARIQEKVFPHRFLEALVDIEEVLDDIENNGMLTRWKGFESLTNKSLLNKVGTNLESKGFNFIANLQALNIFIGRSFVECILLEV